MTENDDVVILSASASTQGFKGHLLLSKERIKAEPAGQTGMTSLPDSGLAVPSVNARGSLRPPVVLRSSGPRLNPALQSSSVFFRYVNPQDPLQPAAASAGTQAPPHASAGSQSAWLDQTTPVPLDSRLILSHVSPLENNDSHQVLNSIKFPHEASNVIKCIECCDQFYFRHCYQHHRERQVVSITYNCEICMRKLLFYNKCALFAHVRTHKLGSVDPSKLTICSLPLTKLKTLSEASLKQLVSQLEQAHAKYQETLKALSPDQQPAESAPITIDLEAVQAPENSNGRVAEPAESEKEPATRPAAAVESASEAVNSGEAAATQQEKQQAKQPESQQRCAVCDSEVASLAEHLGDSLKECPLCKKIVPDSRCSLQSHMRLHVDVSSACPECGEQVGADLTTQLEREVAMRTHLRMQCLHLQRSKVFICLKCEYPPRAFSTIRQLADHIIHSHTEKFFKCSVCTLAFRRTNQLSSHLEKEHGSPLVNKPSKIFKCPICNLIFNDPPSLNQHLSGHLPHQNFCRSAMAFRCLDSCRQIFLEKKSLRRHLASCNSSPVADDNLPCLLCESSSAFKSLPELREHEETHLDKSAGGWCPFCEEDVASDLLEHLRAELRGSQAPLREPVCHCGARLPDPEALAKHMNEASHPISTETHLTEPQTGPDVVYKCRECDERLCATELTEHIFVEHAGLCYLCNSRPLTPAHLHACLVGGSLEGREPSAPAAKEVQSEKEEEAPEDAASESESLESCESKAGACFCPLCLDPLDSAADLQRHMDASHRGSSGFKRPAERDQRKLEAVKMARVEQPASGIACSVCTMPFLTKAALQVHQLATRHDC